MSHYGPRYRHGGYVGGKEQPLHYVWRSMLARCYNPKSKDFSRYGARGIAVCKRWHDYKNFAADMGPHPGGGMTVERKNNARGYSPSNCVWASTADQNRNRSCNKILEHQGRRMLISDWARELGISKALASWRMKNWSTLEKGKSWRLLNQS